MYKTPIEMAWNNLITTCQQNRLSERLGIFSVTELGHPVHFAEKTDKLIGLSCMESWTFSISNCTCIHEYEILEDSAG